MALIREVQKVVEEGHPSLTPLAGRRVRKNLPKVGDPGHDHVQHALVLHIR